MKKRLAILSCFLIPLGAFSALEAQPFTIDSIIPVKNHCPEVNESQNYHRETTLSTVANNGSYVTTTDGQTLLIREKDQRTVKTWKSAAKVTEDKHSLSHSALHSQYPIMIRNMRTHQVAYARLADGGGCNDPNGKDSSWHNTGVNKEQKQDREDGECPCKKRRPTTST